MGEGLYFIMYEPPHGHAGAQEQCLHSRTSLCSGGNADEHTSRYTHRLAAYPMSALYFYSLFMDYGVTNGRGFL